MNPTVYGWVMLAGIVLTIVFWSRLVRRDERLMLIYLIALGSAFLGAKLVWLAAEGWLHWRDSNFLLQFATGKSVLGALLGGYAGVEIAKRVLGYTRTTGDWFALIAPLGIAIGRVGCTLHGCCLGRECKPSWFTTNDAGGVARWPAAPVELVFNLAMLGLALHLRAAKKLPGQHFHIYLIAYGAFRFTHEFLRATPAVVGNLSGYQFAALAVLALGAIRFAQRRATSTIPADGRCAARKWPESNPVATGDSRLDTGSNRTPE